MFMRLSWTRTVDANYNEIALVLGCDSGNTLSRCSECYFQSRLKRQIVTWDRDVGERVGGAGPQPILSAHPSLPRCKSRPPPQRAPGLLNEPSSHASVASLVPTQNFALRRSVDLAGDNSRCVLASRCGHSVPDVDH
jgi:hypothetical protein